MVNTNNFDIESLLSPTNQDLTINFIPDQNVVSYQYRILKSTDSKLKTNDELVSPTTIYSDYVTVNSNNALPITLTETGVYQLEFITTDYYGNTKIINSGYYVIDKEAPVINTKFYNNQIIEYKIGEDEFNLFEDVSAFDNYDGDLLEQITTNYDELNLSKPGINKLTYTVSDSAGNIETRVLNINAIKSNINVVHTFQIILCIVLFLLAIYFYFYNHAVRLEKRISKYSIEPINKYTFSIIDKALSIYRNIIDFMKKYISKSVFIEKHSKKFDKYVGIVDNFHNDSMELICSKIFVSLITLVIAVMIKTIMFKTLALEEIFIPVLLGYLSLNAYYFLKYKQYRNRLENDLLQAIIVMNNAFKSGRSITQAIELVTKELEGPIANEFKLMHMQLQFGLSLDVAFSKFAERMNIEEVNYLTASLSILNKTGGNIIKVFSSIEKTLFNKKKLKLELKSLTGSSRIIMYLLSGLPIFLVVVIGIINPNYFISLYTTPLGFVISFIVLLIYVSYIMVVRKIMKVRM